MFEYISYKYSRNVQIQIVEKSSVIEKVFENTEIKRISEKLEQLFHEFVWNFEHYVSLQ